MHLNVFVLHFCPSLLHFSANFPFWKHDKWNSLYLTNPYLSFPGAFKYRRTLWERGTVCSARSWLARLLQLWGFCLQSVQWNTRETARVLQWKWQLWWWDPGVLSILCLSLIKTLKARTSSDQSGEYGTKVQGFLSSERQMPTSEVKQRIKHQKMKRILHLELTLTFVKGQSCNMTAVAAMQSFGSTTPVFTMPTKTAFFASLRLQLLV